MSIFTDEDKKDSTRVNTPPGADAKTYSSSSGTSQSNIDIQARLPEFMPSALADFSLCTSATDVEKAKQHLEAFKQQKKWTEQKFAHQKNAADMAFELLKSKNALIKHLAKVCIKQANNDVELAAFLDAIPQMLAHITGTRAEKTQRQVKSFTDRISNAGKGKQAKSK